MIYVMSDLHGCYDKYIKMVNLINLQENDTLYILGDIVDRGPNGIKILQHMMTQINIITIRGNHDFMSQYLLKKIMGFKNFDSIRENMERVSANDNFNIDEFAKLSSENRDDLLAMTESVIWLSDGGMTTLKEFTELNNEDRIKILNYINSFWIYDEIVVNEQEFFLSHTVPEKHKMLNMSKCTMNDFMYGKPDYDEKYFDNKIIVTGHTPTKLIDEKYDGKIYIKNNHIAIDCGACFGAPLSCIRLDDIKEFYTE